MLNPKIADHHLMRNACIYIRQSTMAQVRFNQESTERQYNLADQAKSLGWMPEQIRILDRGSCPVGSTDGQARRLQDPCERCGDGTSRRDLLSGIFTLGTLEQGLASITGTVRRHQDIGVRRRWLLRSVRLQRQPCPRHERHVRASRTAHHSRAPPRRQAQ